MGGSSANRLTNQSGGLNGDTLAATGGSETHTLTTAQLASHAHSVDPPSTTTSSNGSHTHDVTEKVAIGYDGSFFPIWANGDTESGSNYTVETDSAGSHTHTLNISAFNSASAGSGSAHNNVQPTIIENKIIYTGVA